MEAMQGVLEGLCTTLSAEDASWLAIRQFKVNDLKMADDHFSLVTEEMDGWVPVAASFLYAVLFVLWVFVWWCLVARKSGVDPISRKLIDEAGEARAFIREDVMSDEEWKTHWMARKFLNFYGVGERMAGALPVIDGCECVIVLDRPIKGEPFSASDKRYFQLAITGLQELHMNLCMEHGAIHASTPLSQRERETYRYLLTTMSEAEIADQMGLSAHTVHDYARKLYRKFNVKGRVGLMALVLGAK